MDVERLPERQLKRVRVNGAKTRGNPPPPRRPRASACSASGDKQVLASNIELPLYVREGVEAYMLDNPGHTFRTVVMAGLQALGQREVLPDDTPQTLKPTSLKLRAMSGYALRSTYWGIRRCGSVTWRRLAS
jgi:hypothetical protein